MIYIGQESTNESGHVIARESIRGVDGGEATEQSHIAMMDIQHEVGEPSRCDKTAHL